MKEMLWTGIDSVALPLQRAIEPLASLVRSLEPPRSIAELRLSTESLLWLKRWIQALGPESCAWLSPRIASEEDASGICTRDSFGLLFLSLAAETVREYGDEDSIWPPISSLLPVGHPLRSLLFQRGQPTSLWKETLRSTCQTFGLRNALDIENAQKYYETLKLQMGFTFRGATKRLPDWLDGLGVPLSIELLLGQTVHIQLGSQSMPELWAALQAFRRGRATSAETLLALHQSPWIKGHWIDVLMRSVIARKRRPQTSRPEPLAASDLLEPILEWPYHGQPQLSICVNERVLLPDVPDEIDALQFEVDGVLAATWLKQPSGEWLGDRQLASLLPDGERPNLAPTILTISNRSGSWRQIVNLTAFGTRADVILFDLKTSKVVPVDLPMSQARGYVLLCNSDLSMCAPEPFERRRFRDLTLYRLPEGWSPELQLALDDLTYWQPSLVASQPAPQAGSVLTTAQDRQVELGDNSKLWIVGLPTDSRAAFLLIGGQKYELTPGTMAWSTVETSPITARLALGLERVRVVCITPGRRRLHRPKLSMNLTGVAVIENRGDQDDDPRWREIQSRTDLNLSGGSDYIQLFFGAGKSGSLYEGGNLRLPTATRRPLRLHKIGLAAWGSPLTIGGVETPVARSVEDRGILASYRHFYRQPRPDPPTLFLQSPVNPDDEHHLTCWPIDVDASRTVQVAARDIAVQPGGTRWNFAVKHPLVALGIGFRGVCIGAWWDKAGLASQIRRVLRDSAKGSTELFALLRWMRAPVLGPEIRPAFETLAERRPLDFVQAWLGGDGLQRGLKHRIRETGVDDVVRSALWNSKILNPATLDKVLLTLTSRTQQFGVTREVAALVHAATVCPPLLRDLSQSSLKPYARAAIWTLLDYSPKLGTGELSRRVSALERKYHRESLARGAAPSQSLSEMLDGPPIFEVSGRRLMGVMLLEKACAGGSAT